MVFFDEILNFFVPIKDTVGSEAEAEIVFPWVTELGLPSLDVFADTVDKLDFQKRLSSDEIPYNRFLSENLRVFKNVINRSGGDFKTHPAFCVLAYEVAVTTAQLAVLGDHERDRFRNGLLPNARRFCNSINHGDLQVLY